MTNDDDMTDAEWAEMTEPERRTYQMDRNQEYLESLSGEQRARVEWENS